MSAEIAKLLASLRTSGASGVDATARLAELLYPELKRIAQGVMRHERAGHTLQPTAVLNEAYLRLAAQASGDWQDRSHFLGFATRLMRQVLVDHARTRQSQKRGGDMTRVTLDEAFAGGDAPSLDVLALDQALDRYAAIDARGARIVELRVFGGLTMPEIAAHLGVSERTAAEDWAVARMWMARQLRSS